MAILSAIGKVIDDSNKSKEIEKEVESINRQRSSMVREVRDIPKISDTREDQKLVSFSGITKNNEKIKKEELPVKENKEEYPMKKNKGVVQTAIILSEGDSVTKFNNDVNSELLNLQKDNHEIIDVSISHTSYSDRYRSRANGYVACITYRVI